MHKSTKCGNRCVRCVRCSSTSSHSKMSLDAKEALQEFAKEVWSRPSGWAWCNRLAKALGGENCRGSQRAGSNWSETGGWRGNCRNGRCNWQLKAICVLKCVCESYCTSYFSTVARVFIWFYLPTFRRDTSSTSRFNCLIPRTPYLFYALRVTFDKETIRFHHEYS